VVLLQNKHWFSNTKPDVVQKWRATSEYLFPTLRDSDGAEHRLRCVRLVLTANPVRDEHLHPAVTRPQARFMLSLSRVRKHRSEDVCLVPDGAMFQRSELWFDRQGV